MTEPTLLSEAEIFERIDVLPPYFALTDIQLHPDASISAVAAIEQHGPHLPLDTDVQICRGLVKQVMASTTGGQQLITLPLMEIGESSEHSDFPGTLSCPPEHLISLWTSLGKQIQKVGIKKLLILTIHKV